MQSTALGALVVHTAGDASVLWPIAIGACRMRLAAVNAGVARHIPGCIGLASPPWSVPEHGWMQQAIG
jgi:hypothetical protein